MHLQIHVRPQADTHSRAHALYLDMVSFEDRSVFLEVDEGKVRER